jgi:hypothetical protein
MKTIKLITLSLLFFAGGKLAAQNNIVVNNTWFTGGSADFVYTPSPCSVFTMPFPAFGSNTLPYFCAANPTSVVLTFNDPSCPPALNPRSVTIPVPALLPTTVVYTGCNGIRYNFTLDYPGSTSWRITIN